MLGAPSSRVSDGAVANVSTHGTPWPTMYSRAASATGLLTGPTTTATLSCSTSLRIFEKPDVRLAFIVLVDQLDLPPADLTADLLHRDFDARLVEGAQRRQRPGERQEHADR